VIKPEGWEIYADQFKVTAVKISKSRMLSGVGSLFDVVALRNGFAVRVVHSTVPKASIVCSGNLSFLFAR
jgi:hypothetical protein